MSKSAITFFFYGTLLFSWFVMVASMGWFLGLFGIFLVPVMILHILAGAKAMHRAPQLNKRILFSGLMILLFALFRPDMDDVHGYTGYTTLLEFFDLRNNRFTEVTNFHFVLSLGFLLLMIIADIIMLRKAKKVPPVPPATDFV